MHHKRIILGFAAIVLAAGLAQAPPGAAQLAEAGQAAPQPSEPLPKPVDIASAEDPPAANTGEAVATSDADVTIQPEMGTAMVASTRAARADWPVEESRETARPEAHEDYVQRGPMSKAQVRNQLAILFN